MCRQFKLVDLRRHVISAGMPQLVRMHFELKTCFDACPLTILAKPPVVKASPRSLTKIVAPGSSGLSALRARKCCALNGLAALSPPLALRM